ncbi:MAG: type 4a pilus biogenesis protein PilO [Candidatus Riflebacteria bacterium]|nr:type 4a pilus biogenesis protein PilO [Candidatus Riflebacteria bacterium]
MISKIEVKQLWEDAPLPIIVGVLIFLSPYFFFDFQKEEIATNELKMDELLKKTCSDVQWKWKSEISEKYFKNLEYKMASIANLLPAESSIPDVINLVSKSAEKAGLKIIAVSYDISRKNKESVDSFPKMKMNLDIVGEYPALKIFLQIIEDSLFRILPVEISLTAEGKFLVKLMVLLRPS